jgi:ADP-ribose pyrophosphatase YjhB (NUDIX family)
VSDPAAKFATPRVAAGALFVKGDRILLVRKTYSNGWDIPGGYLDAGESPAAACRRELKEELGIRREPRQLLIIDWAPHMDEGDKILYIFDCGDLGADENRIQLAADEVDRWEWVPVGRLPDYVIPRLARRLARAYQAHAAGTQLCLRTRPARVESFGQRAGTATALTHRTSPRTAEIGLNNDQGGPLRGPRRDGGDGLTRAETAWTWGMFPLAISRCFAQRYHRHPPASSGPRWV